MGSNCIFKINKYFWLIVSLRNIGFEFVQSLFAVFNVLEYSRTAALKLLIVAQFKLLIGNLLIQLGHII